MRGKTQNLAKIEKGAKNHVLTFSPAGRKDSFFLKNKKTSTAGRFACAESFIFRAPPTLPSRRAFTSRIGCWEKAPPMRFFAFFLSWARGGALRDKIENWGFGGCLSEICATERGAGEEEFFFGGMEKLAVVALSPLSSVLSCKSCGSGPQLALFRLQSSLFVSVILLFMLFRSLVYE